MTNIGHFRAAAKVLEGAGRQHGAQLWVCPPTRMDEEQLKEEGYYAIFEAAGAASRCPAARCAWATRPGWRTTPSCSPPPPATSTTASATAPRSTWAAPSWPRCAPSWAASPAPEEYLAIAAEKIDPYGEELYRYLNFDQIEGFEDQGRVVSAAEEEKVLAGV